MKKAFYILSRHDVSVFYFYVESTEQIAKNWDY